MIEEKIYIKLIEFVEKNNKNEKIERIEIKIIIDSMMEQIIKKEMDILVKTPLNIRKNINEYLKSNPNCRIKDVLDYCKKICEKYEEYFDKKYIDYDVKINDLIKNKISGILKAMVDSSVINKKEIEEKIREVI